MASQAVGGSCVVPHAFITARIYVILKPSNNYTRRATCAEDSESHMHLCLRVQLLVEAMQTMDITLRLRRHGPQLETNGAISYTLLQVLHTLDANVL